MGTFGSRTTPQMGSQLRKVAASTRAVLIQMAAEQWQVPEAGLVAEEGEVRDPKSQKTVSYADLTHGQKLMKVIAAEPPLTNPKDWKIAGSGIPKLDGREFVTGAHKSASDQIRPGMLYGKVVRFCWSHRARPDHRGTCGRGAPSEVGCAATSLGKGPVRAPEIHGGETD
jgi:CO/xanthine dehydrogenase Mo-binding subunit